MENSQLNSALQEFGWELRSVKGLEKELYKEVEPGHVLFGKVVECVAQNGDDVLYRIVEETEDPSNLDNAEYAEVHLTWTSKAHETPPWPHTRIYSSFSEWHDEILNSVYIVPASPAVGQTGSSIRRITGLSPFTFYGVTMIVFILVLAYLLNDLFI